MKVTDQYPLFHCMSELMVSTNWRWVATVHVWACAWIR